MNIRTFNTGRQYTEHGQRIAWTILRTGTVAMVDIDRSLDCILEVSAIDPTNADVLWAYDRNVYAEWNSAEYKEFARIRRALEMAAFCRT